MNVILGRNVYIEFDIDGFKFFGCAENVEYSQTTETKSTRTVGSGYWKSPRGQSNAYSIALTGLIPVDSTGYSTPLDLMEYQRQMVPISYRIIFEDENGDQIHQIRGIALVTEGQLTGPVDFAGSSFTLQGVGAPEFGLPPTCDITIFEFELTPPEIGFSYHAAVLGEFNGPAVRYDWSIDNATTPINTALSTGWIFNVLTEVGAPNVIGNHTLYIWPVCANGVYGNKYEHNFTVTP